MIFCLNLLWGGEKWARYSFLGTKPKKIFRFLNGQFEIDELGKGSSVKKFQNCPLEVLREEFENYSAYQDPDLPRFFGGAVGYIGYDMVRYFENIEMKNAKDKDLPDLFMILTDTVVIFDSLQQLMKIVNTVHIPSAAKNNEKELKNIYNTALRNISETKDKLDVNLEHPSQFDLAKLTGENESVDEEKFCQIVEQAREYIKAGDIFQVVLSMRFELQAKGINPLQIYRSIRRINPSPYMYYLGFKDLAIVGASPEVLVRLEDDNVEVRPIAGTRKRGKDDARDKELEEELLNDPKEKAEHIMLLDLGRNDLGRVAKTGTVQVDEFETIERYSHVMHMVSHVSGKLAAHKDVFDVIRATFPAGTLSGAPKIRAMEIIEELEDHSRGIYGGAIGYISFTKNTDLAITIRTAVIRGDEVIVQAGAGVVYNSVPKLEYKESRNKALGMIAAIKETVS